MTNLPEPEEDDARELVNSPADVVASHSPTPAQLTPDTTFVSYAASIGQSDAPPISQPGAPATPSSYAEPLLFQSYAQIPIRPPARIPNLGHLAMLIPIGGVAFAGTIALLLAPMHFHWFGWSMDTQAAATNVQLILATEVILYLITFAISLVVFPQFWNEGFFAGLQWRGAVVLQGFWPLVLPATAAGCAVLAVLDEVLMPGPSNAPIEEMMRSPGAAWLMFAFGTTVAPFFEEMFFRGFLLPALCTAWDWTVEQITHNPAPPLDANGAPQWSLAAMAVASVLTSIPFALLHVDQQGHALGPFLLLILVSLVLCTVRLATKSLAASTLVHASYNFIIFSLAMIGTGGFRHFDKM
ncbi:MAG: CPBP family intramembrane glutamic endopeptidase [Terracidiphilus sp.]